MGFFRANISIAFLSLLSLGIFLFLCALVVTGKSAPLDSSLLRTVALFQKSDITNIMLSLSFIFHPAFLSLGSFVLFLILLFLKKKMFALFFLLTILGSILSAVTFKALFDIPRPMSTLAQALGPGFPSTHATAAAVFFLTLFYVVRHTIKDRTISFLFEVVAISLIILCGISRLYLSVHWPSDVIAGFALGFFWVTLAVLIMKRQEEKHQKRVM